MGEPARVHNARGFFIDTRGDSPYLLTKHYSELEISVQRDRFSCVIFDMDGTLTQTNELIFASFNHITQKYLGKCFTPKEIVGFFGPPEEGAIEKLLGAELLDQAMDELCEFYRTHHGAMAKLHSGIETILQLLKERGTRLALFTGKGHRTATITLEAFGIARFFEYVVSGNDVVNHKPHHEGIQKVLDKFSVSPNEVLMIGDSMSDVRASRGAGVKIAAVLWDSYDKERVLAANADFVFHNVGEMHEWFRLHTN